MRNAIFRTSALVACFLVAGLTVGQQSAKPMAMPAGKVLAKAQAQAEKEKKNVLVLFHASWCGWCHKLDGVMADPTVKPFFDKSFVSTHLVVQESPDKKNLENPGGEELLNKWHGKDQGIPYFVVMSPKGEILADSRFKGKNGKLANMGCPAEPEEIDAFIAMMKKTTKISASDEKALRARLGKVKSGG